MNQIINSELINVNISLNDKESVFKYLSELLVETGYATNKKSILEALEKREAESTTGMMDGFAIPHAKSADIKKPSVAILKLNKSIAWESMDGQPIQFIVALFIPEKESGKKHLQLLSKIAKLLMRKEFRESFKNASSKEDLAVIVEREFS